MEEVAAMPSNTQEFCLRWNNFHSSLVSALDGFKNDLDFVDVTLACEGQFLKAHKMLLSACSAFFRDLLKANPCQHPIIILPPDVRFIDLERMLRFIYQGEVNVQQEHLARFLKTAEMLKIRGLADDNEKKTLRSTSPKLNDTSNSSERNGENHSVSPKRPRLSIEAQSNSDISQTHNEDNSRLSGADSDSEMLPVKQEMIELKECDFEGADAESFIPEAYLREGTSSASANNNSNSQQPPQNHPAAPPPPGPLLPSYVPPPQVKSQDDSSLGSNHDDLSQGTFARLVVDSAGEGGEGRVMVETVSPWGPGETPKSSMVSRLALPRSTSIKLVTSSKTMPLPAAATSKIPLSTDATVELPKVCEQAVSPIQIGTPAIESTSSPSVFIINRPVFTSPVSSTQTTISPSTGSSLAIWHPPQQQNSPADINLASIPSSGIVVFNTVPVTTAMTVPGGISLTCDICYKTFTSRSNLNKHKRVQHSGEEYVCPKCHRTFKNRYYIKDHVNICSSQPFKKAASSNLNSAKDEVAIAYETVTEEQPSALIKKHS